MKEASFLVIHAIFSGRHFCVGNACALAVTAAKIDLALHSGTRFRHHISIYRCRDYLPEVVSAPLKFWAPVLKFFQDRCVYTAVTGSAVSVRCQNFGVPCQFFGACESVDPWRLPEEPSEMTESVCKAKQDVA